MGRTRKHFNPALLPGLPNDLALLCLARLPRGIYGYGRCVSRAWRLALQPSSIEPLRRSLGITEEWVFLCLSAGLTFLTSTTHAWLLLDPQLSHCNALPPPITPRPLEGKYAQLPVVQGIAAGNDLLVVGIDTNIWSRALDVGIIFCFDVVGRQWCSPAPRMCVDRRCFASAMLGNFVYVAGGHVALQGRNPTLRRLNSAERFNTKTREWEMLPDMNKARDHCSGFIMDGCFFVIGGFPPYENTGHNSAEFFDPSTGVWTLVPNMWPEEMVSRVTIAPTLAMVNEQLETAPSVAMVNEQLYALRNCSREVMWYEKLSNSWVTMGYFPAAEKCECDSSCHRIIGVGKELWVILNDRHCEITMLASKPEAPLLSDSLTWRPLPFKLEGGFTKVSTCAVFEV